MTHHKKTIRFTLTALVLVATCVTAPRDAAADASPFVGEIAPMGFNFCPRGWASADGQLLAISQNDALFSLLGTTFGGDGRTTFGLPDLRGRVPMGRGQGVGLTPNSWGEKKGLEETALEVGQLANHSHAVNATNLDGDKPGPGNKLLAAAPKGGTGSETIYSDQGPTVQMSAQMIAPTGQGAAFSVQDPSQVIRYCIALVGVYPSRP